MVKKILCVIFFYFFCSHIFSMEYEEFVNIVLANSKEYQIALSQYNLKKYEAFDLTYDWIPKFDLNLNYMGNLSFESSNQVHAFTANVNITQQLPMGINLNLGFDNTFMLLKIKNSKNYYESSAIANFSIPLYFFSPHLLKPYSEAEIFAKKNSLYTASLELQQIKDKIIAEAISIVGFYWIQKERLEVEKSKSLIYSNQRINDEALWAQGKLSTFELSEREAGRYNSQVKLLDVENKYLKMSQNLLRMGFNENIISVDADIEEWIRYLETYIENTYTSTDYKLLIQENNLNLNKYYTLLQKINELPRFTFSFKIDPASESLGADKFMSTIKDYWAADKKWKYSIGIGINIPLSPLDEVYGINKSTKEILRINQLNYKVIKEQYKNKKHIYETDLKILRELCELSKKNEINIYNRLVLADTLLVQGNITELDLKWQQLSYRLAQLQTIEARLNYIIKVLSF